MAYFGHHAADLRSGFMLHYLVHLTQTEGLEGELLALRTIDTALHLFDSDLRHGYMLLSVEYFGQFHTALLGDGIGITHQAQRFERSLHYVMRVGRTFRLAQYVFHTYAFQYGTHSTAGNYTGTVGSRLQEYGGGAVLGHDFVRNGAFVNRNFDQVLLGIVNSFGDGFGNLIGFTQAITHHTVFVSYYHDGRKTEVTTTFGYFGHAVDGYQTVLQLNFA